MHDRDFTTQPQETKHCAECDAELTTDVERLRGVCVDCDS